MMAKFDIGEIVAASMQEIVQSKAHRQIFKKADKCCSCSSKCGQDCSCAKDGKCGSSCEGCESVKSASEKCCSCQKCGDSCPCEGKCADCMDCMPANDSNHVHDDKCACGDQMMRAATATAIDEMADLLSKISTVQEELGLAKSATVTLKALATMAAELRSLSQDMAEVNVDENDVRWSDLISPIQEDTELRRDWRADAEEFPGLMELLKRRVDESHEGSEPVKIDYLSPEAHHDTEIPGGQFTEVPPPSEMLPVSLPHPESIDSFMGLLGDQTVGEENNMGTDSPAESNYGPNKSTKPPPKKSAFERLDMWLSKQGQLEDSDFEDENFGDELELARQKRLDEEDEKLLGEDLDKHYKDPMVNLDELIDNEEGDEPGFLEEDLEMPDLFGLESEVDMEDLHHDDDMFAADIDQEIESGDFLGSPDDAPDTINYGGQHEDLEDEFNTSGIGFSEEGNQKVRVAPNEWVSETELPFEDLLSRLDSVYLNPEKQEDIDPDQMSYENFLDSELEDDEDVNPDPELKMMDDISKRVSYDPSDDDYNPEAAHFWSGYE